MSQDDATATEDEVTRDEGDQNDTPDVDPNEGKGDETPQPESTPETEAPAEDQHETEPGPEAPEACGGEPDEPQTCTGPSCACKSQLEFIEESAKLPGTIHVPESDPGVIAEIKEIVPEEILNRCCFGADSGQGSVG